MARYRVGYNEKGRASGISKQRQLRRERMHRRERTAGNDEASEPVAASGAARPAILDGIDTAGMSAKRKRRLEKYVETKLKKDEGRLMMERLAELQGRAQEGGAGMANFKALTRKRKVPHAESAGPHSASADTGKRAHTGSSDEQEGQSDAGDDDNEIGRDFGYGRVNDDPLDSAAPKVLAPAQPFTGFGSFPAATFIKRKTKPLAYNWRSRLAQKAKTDKRSSDEDDDSSDHDDGDEYDNDDGDDDDDDDDDEHDDGDDDDDEHDDDDDENENDDDDDDDDEEANKSSAHESLGEPNRVPQTDGKKAAAAFRAHMAAKNTQQDASSIGDIPEAVLKEHQARVRQRDASPEPQGPIRKAPGRRTAYVTPKRPLEVEEMRSLLPAVAEEQRIMEAIFAEPCVVICGETGSGKTTQIPQFLVEAGFGSNGSDNPGMICVTQPRRVAAVSMAKRVSYELGEGLGQRVAYQIRFDSTTREDTLIKFATDGVLLREIANDFLLSRYSVVVVDEAHERSINTDILIGLLSRIARLREKKAAEGSSGITPLKLVIMSATLRVKDFVENKELFAEPPPVINISARQHPVTVHFSRVTPVNYIDACFSKVCKIHQRLPPGAILVFVTGQNEILELCRRLEERFGTRTRGGQAASVRVDGAEIPLELEDIEASQDRIVDDEDMASDDDEEEDEDIIADEPASGTKKQQLYVLPLYSLLTTQDQMRVFQEPPPGSRLCVVATNVAETSLTIPNVRYVVDSGLSKERKYDERTGVQSFQVDWISKASANQRAGRAGRTGPGHCYRVYSSAVYERDFAEFSRPEILRTPIEGIVLQMKAMNIHVVTNFPFPTPPDRQSLQNADKVLQALGAVDREGSITSLGRTMAQFPVAPRFARMLSIGGQFDCMPYVICVVAGLSVEQVFLQPHDLSSDQRKLLYKSQQRFTHIDSRSDVMMLLSAICAYEYSGASESFCRDNFLRFKSMQEIGKLRRQLHGMVQAVAAAPPGSFTTRLAPPSAQQIVALRQITAAGFLDRIARYTGHQDEYETLAPIGAASDSVHVNPRSVLARRDGAWPDYVVYQTLSQSSNSNRLSITPLVPLSAKELSSLVLHTPLVTYSAPLMRPEPPALVQGSNGQRRTCWVILRVGSGAGWELPARKVTQVRRHGIWQVEP